MNGKEREGEGGSSQSVEGHSIEKRDTVSKPRPTVSISDADLLSYCGKAKEH